MTTAMWSIIDRGDVSEMAKALEQDPDLVYLRSEVRFPSHKVLVSILPCP